MKTPNDKRNELLQEENGIIYSNVKILGEQNVNISNENPLKVEIIENPNEFQFDYVKKINEGKVDIISYFGTGLNSPIILLNIINNSIDKDFLINFDLKGTTSFEYKIWGNRNPAGGDDGVAIRQNKKLNETQNSNIIAYLKFSEFSTPLGGFGVLLKHNPYTYFGHTKEKWIVKPGQMIGIEIISTSTSTSSFYGIEAECIEL